jgi:hypothetical protein
MLGVPVSAVATVLSPVLVPDTVAVAEAVKVAPSTIVKVELVAGSVIATLEIKGTPVVVVFFNTPVASPESKTLFIPTTVNAPDPVASPVCVALVTSPEYKELVELSPVFVPLTAVVPVTASVGVDVPDKVTPFTLEGVIAPSDKEIAGVVVLVATLPDTPFAVVTDTSVTVPLPLGVTASNPLSAPFLLIT